MKPPNSSGPTAAALRAGSQRGDALLEALVGVVLTAVIALGLAYGAARVQVSQRYQTAQSAVLLGMIKGISTTGLSALCSQNTPLPIGTTTITASPATCTQAAVSVTGGGLSTIALPAGPITSMSFSTPSTTATEALIGGSGVLTLSM